MSDDVKIDMLKYYAGKESISGILPSLVETLYLVGYSVQFTFFGRNFGQNTGYETNVNISRAHFVIITATNAARTSSSSMLLDLGSISGTKLMCFSKQGETLDSTPESKILYEKFVDALANPKGDLSAAARDYTVSLSTRMNNTVAKSPSESDISVMEDMNVSSFKKYIKTTSTGFGCVFLGNTSVLKLSMGFFNFQIMFRHNGTIGHTATYTMQYTTPTVLENVVALEARDELSWFDVDNKERCAKEAE
jgi:hypothetical protein